MAKHRAAWLIGPDALCDSPPLGRPSPWRLILLGAPGVGKGTQAQLLTDALQACHLSTGDVFRTAGRQADCAPSPAMAEALAHMRRGELVPDSTVWHLVRERSRCLRCGGGFILDGFPRTLGQAESLEHWMIGERLTLSAVVNYDLPRSEIVSRLSGRRTCPQCKAVYHVTANPPREEGRCDECHAALFQREDDRPESVAVRMKAYERETQPLIDFYAARGLLVSVTAAGTPEEILARTLESLPRRQ